MDQITIKTPNPRGRLYWCLIEFIDYRYIHTCWYFPCVNKYKGAFIQCVKGEYRVVWRASKGVIHCVFDLIPNLKN
jgi:hypothetical protein